MKRLYATIIILMTVIVIHAVPARRGICQTLTLTDGTQLKAELKGDEHVHFWKSEDGRCWVRDSVSGLYKQVEETLLKELRQARISRRSLARKARRQANKEQTVYKGSHRGLIILVEYQDMKFQESNTPELFENIANTPGFTNDMGFQGSVHDYFLDQSYGQFDLTFDVVGPITLEHDYAYYGKDVGKEEGNDAHPEEMVVEACKALDDTLDFTPYDWNDDGYVDQVFVLYAGEGQASCDDTNTVWQHEWNLSEAGIGPLEFDGKYVDTYACSSEIALGSIDGIGTICHEFSHCLGLPDMYDTDSTDGVNFGMDAWDLMDYGCYNNNSFTPSGYTSYERMFCGWLVPEEITDSMTVTDLKPLAVGGGAYVIYNQAHTNEYYLLENRQKVGWDAALPGNGLLVLHVDYNLYDWYYNIVNNDADHQRCSIFHADNSDGTTRSNLAGDPYPYKDNNSLTPTSKPAATYFNKNTAGEYFMEGGITDITQNNDQTIGFVFTPIKTSVPTGQVFYESFDKCSGKGGNDDLWSGVIATSSLETDNEWDINLGYGANQCARFGNSKAMGYAVIPEITIDGDYLLTFKAAPWNEEENFMYVTVEEGDSLWSENILDFMTPKQWNNHEVKISGKGTVSLTIRSNQRRFFLDEVSLTRNESGGSETGIVELKVDVPEDNAIYSLDGRKMQDSWDELPRGVYIVGGKKVMR